MTPPRSRGTPRRRAQRLAARAIAQGAATGRRRWPAEWRWTLPNSAAGPAARCPVAACAGTPPSACCPGSGWAGSAAAQVQVHRPGGPAAPGPRGRGRPAGQGRPARPPPNFRCTGRAGRDGAGRVPLAEPPWVDPARRARAFSLGGRPVPLSRSTAPEPENRADTAARPGATALAGGPAGEAGQALGVQGRGGQRPGPDHGVEHERAEQHVVDDGGGQHVADRGPGDVQVPEDHPGQREEQFPGGGPDGHHADRHPGGLVEMAADPPGRRTRPGRTPVRTGPPGGWRAAPRPGRARRRSRPACLPWGRRSAPAPPPRPARDPAGRPRAGAGCRAG